MKFVKTLILFSIALCPVIQAYTITAFDAANFISPGALPTPAQTASMDATLGLTGLTVEDFEDDNLINGLSMSLTVAGSVFDPALPSVFATSQAPPIWDGNRGIVTSIGGELEGNFGATPGDFDAIFRYSPGADTFGIGIGDVNQDIRILINGTEDLGIVDEIPGYNITFDNGRDAYLVINRLPGEAAITEVRFVGTPVGDGVFFDHLVVETTVPEPSSYIFMMLALLVCWKKHSSL